MNKQEIQKLLDSKKQRLVQIANQVFQHKNAIEELLREEKLLTGDWRGKGEVAILEIKLKQADLKRFVLVSNSIFEIRGEVCLLKETPKQFHIARFGVDEKVVVLKNSHQGEKIKEALE